LKKYGIHQGGWDYSASIIGNDKTWGSLIYDVQNLGSGAGCWVYSRVYLRPYPWGILLGYTEQPAFDIEMKTIKDVPKSLSIHQEETTPYLHTQLSINKL